MRSIYANRYVADSGWGAPQLIETGSGYASDAQVAMDASGNAIAVWHQNDGTNNSIFANRYVAGSGWGTAELIETGSGYAYAPQIAIDASGNAIAVWELHAADWSSSSAYANRYVPGSGWGAAEVFAASGGSNKYATQTQIVMQSNGNAIAVWAFYDGATSTVNARGYVAGSGWGTAQRLDTGSNGVDDPSIAIDASGNAIAVWTQYDGSVYNIQANRFD
jgi:hypothetical protein